MALSTSHPFPALTIVRRSRDGPEAERGYVAHPEVTAAEPAPARRAGGRDGARGPALRRLAGRYSVGPRPDWPARPPRAGLCDCVADRPGGRRAKPARSVVILIGPMLTTRPDKARRHPFGMSRITYSGAGVAILRLPPCGCGPRWTALFLPPWAACCGGLSLGGPEHLCHCLKAVRCRRATAGQGGQEAA